jgi:hypothetical protein
MDYLCKSDNAFPNLHYIFSIEALFWIFWRTLLIFFFQNWLLILAWKKSPLTKTRKHVCQMDKNNFLSTQTNRQRKQQKNRENDERTGQTDNKMSNADTKVSKRESK